MTQNKLKQDSKLIKKDLKLDITRIHDKKTENYQTGLFSTLQKKNHKHQVLNDTKMNEKHTLLHVSLNNSVTKPSFFCF